MYENIKIDRLDHFGVGIAHINNLVVFVSDALPGEVVDIQITSSKKTYSEAKVLRYIKKSKDRITSPCPYFNECGGCNLLFYKYDNTINFKYNKIKELLAKNKLGYDGDIEIIKNKSDFNYRNKISLKIKNGILGFYEKHTHNIVEINTCLVANTEINKIIKNYKLLNIKDGELTIRCNLNKEILLIINTLEKDYNIELTKLKEIVKLVGIVYNNKTIYGNNFLYERIGGFLFKVSFNSFFQVNPYICTELFSLLNNYISDNSKVLDLYSGVGTLSIVASAKAKEVISVEIIKNAVINGIFNAKLNKRNNIKFMLGDVSKIVSKIKYNFDTLIVDPPRKGLDKKTKEFIKMSKPEKIIYISCDANTLMRDIIDLDYKIKEYKILDMFSYSYHIESFVLLEKNN